MIIKSENINDIKNYSLTLLPVAFKSTSSLQNKLSELLEVAYLPGEEPEQGEEIRDKIDSSIEVKGLPAVFNKSSRPKNSDSLKTNWGFKDENKYNNNIPAAISQKWDKPYPLPAMLVKGMIAVESGFDNDVVSATGYAGLMQLGKNEAKSQGLSLYPVDERFVQDKNIKAGIGTLSIKNGVIMNPDKIASKADGTQPWYAKEVDGAYKKLGKPNIKDMWYLSLGAYNGGGATTLMAMAYANRKGLDPRVWSNLTAPMANPTEAPLYKAILEVYGPQYALSKFYQMANYPVKIMKYAGEYIK